MTIGKNVPKVVLFFVTFGLVVINCIKKPTVLKKVSRFLVVAAAKHSAAI